MSKIYLSDIVGAGSSGISKGLSKLAAGNLMPGTGSVINPTVTGGVSTQALSTTTYYTLYLDTAYPSLVILSTSTASTTSYLTVNHLVSSGVNWNCVILYQSDTPSIVADLSDSKPRIRAGVSTSMTGRYFYWIYG